VFAQKTNLFSCAKSCFGVVVYTFCDDLKKQFAYFKTKNAKNA
jgi:hypothetical protein